MAYREFPVRGVILEVFGHGVFAGKGPPGGWKWQAGKGIVLRRGEEAQGIPSAPPHVADAGLRVQDEEILQVFLQVVSGGEPRLPCAHNYRVHCLIAVHREAS
ncbi:hypothetical protein AHiyo8_37940 [Arthrobacter sp. Hiyo8]|nr:hypothetical protein AHiyo8_37940 [Arthrobacter sp. Hiyo8]